MWKVAIRPCKNTVTQVKNLATVSSGLFNSWDANLSGVTTPTKQLHTTARQTSKETQAQAEKKPTPIYQGRCMKLAAHHADLTPWESITQREVFNNDQYKHVKNYLIQTLELSEDGKTLDVTFEDEHQSRYHAIWLRHACHCPKCRLPYTGRTYVDFEHIDADAIRMTSAIADDGVVIVGWQDRADPDSLHEGMIPLAFLRGNCYDDKTRMQRQAQRQMEFYSDKGIPEFSYEDIKSSEQGKYKWLKMLSERGACLLKNVPTEERKAVEIGEWIGPVTNNWYGDVFDVMSKAGPPNPNFSPVKLFPHMDLMYYESPPGIQVMHCIKFDSGVVGGSNTLVDLFEVAHKFRREYPDEFRILCQIPFGGETVHYNRDPPIHLSTTRPVFTLNGDGELIAAVWHPMSYGAVKCHADDVVPFYKAYTKLFTMINTYPSIYNIRLQPGDALCFNNRRLLHSRAAYQVKHGMRHLQGTYVEITTFQSRLQALHNQLGNGSIVKRAGSYDWL